MKTTKPGNLIWQLLRICFDIVTQDKSKIIYPTNLPVICQYRPIPTVTQLSFKLGGEIAYLGVHEISKVL